MTKISLGMFLLFGLLYFVVPRGLVSLACGYVALLGALLLGIGLIHDMPSEDRHEEP